MLWAIATFALLASAVAASAWTKWLTAPRLNEPVSIATSFSLERPITLRVADRHLLELLFDRRDASYPAMRALVGGALAQKIEREGRLVDAGEPSGLLIPLEWSLRTQAGSVVAQGRCDVLGSNSWSSTDVGRLLHQADFEAGEYMFSAARSAGIPEFQGVRVRVRVSVEPKLSHSRLMSTYWLAKAYIPAALFASLATGTVALWTWLW